jgi:hypothetical protein
VSVNKRPMGHITHLKTLAYIKIFFQYEICISFPFAPSDTRKPWF